MINKTAMIAAGTVVLVALASWQGYRAGAEHERNRCEAERAAAIEAALARREQVEAIGRGISRRWHEQQAELAERAEEIRREIRQEVADEMADSGDDPVCFTDDGVRELNATLRGISGLPVDH